MDRRQITFRIKCLPTTSRLSILEIKEKKQWEGLGLSVIIKSKVQILLPSSKILGATIKPYKTNMVSSLNLLLRTIQVKNLFINKKLSKSSITMEVVHHVKSIVFNPHPILIMLMKLSSKNMQLEITVMIHTASIRLF